MSVAHVPSARVDGGEDYDAFIERAGKNALAWEVKLADLADNSDRSRHQLFGPEDEARLAK